MRSGNKGGLQDLGGLGVGKICFTSKTEFDDLIKYSNENKQ